MKRLAYSLLGMIGGYMAGAVGGYFLVMQASSNSHDKPVEAGMTGAFVTGPLGATVCGVIGFLLGRRRG